MEDGLINKIIARPDDYGVKTSLPELEGLIEQLDLAYNNGEALVPDTTYDSLVFQLKRKLKVKNRTRAAIGALPVDKLRATLPHPMPSLNKVKPYTREFDSFLKSYGTDVVVSDKLDGVSGLIVYENSQVSKIYTRGNGTIGGDVTYLKSYISLPTLPSDVSNCLIRGEFVITRDRFTTSYSDMYSTGRNFVCAKINAGAVIPEHVADIDFVAYDILSISGQPGLPSVTERFALLDMFGFDVVHRVSMSNKYTFDFVMQYKERRTLSIYDIDGLVLSHDSVSPIVTQLENPKSTVAFKMMLEDQIRSTIITDISWRISRYGKYIPVAEYEAVYIDGCRLRKATAHNAKHVKNWSMGVGTEVTVTRAGGVIPMLVTVQTNDDIVPIYPPDTYEWTWDQRGTHIVLTDIEDNKEVQIKRLEHFFTIISVPRLKYKTLEKLWDSGLNTIKKIIDCNMRDFERVRGIGKVTAKALYDSIKVKMSTTRLDRFLDAFTNVDAGVGRKLAKSVLRVHPDLFTLSQEDIVRNLARSPVKGVGKTRIGTLSRNIPQFVDYLKSLDNTSVIQTIENDKQRISDIEANGYNSHVCDKRFVLTGFFGNTDYDLEDCIYDNHGWFDDTVTDKTTAVIYHPSAGVTAKMTKAHELGLPVMSIKEFYSNIE